MCGGAIGITDTEFSLINCNMYLDGSGDMVGSWEEITSLGPV